MDIPYFLGSFRHRRGRVVIFVPLLIPTYIMHSTSRVQALDKTYLLNLYLIFKAKRWMESHNNTLYSIIEPGQILFLLIQFNTGLNKWQVRRVAMSWHPNKRKCKLQPTLLVLFSFFASDPRGILIYVYLSIFDYLLYVVNN